MTKNIVSRVLLIGFFMIIIYGVVQQTQASPPKGFITKRLTDQNVSVYHAGKPVLSTGYDSAHIAWAEHVTFAPDWDMDVFYTTLPFGVTRHLSTSTANIGSAGGIVMVVDHNDNAYLSWSEGTSGLGGEDMFFWKTGMDAPQNISSPALTVGDVSGMPYLLLDGNNQAHVFWLERAQSNPFFSVVFYWHEGGETLQISDLTYNAHTLNEVAEGNGVFHVLWSASETPFYWNSSTGTIINLRGQLPDFSSYILDSFFKNGILHVLWRDSQNCSCLPDYLRYWNSDDQQNYDLSTTGSNNAHLLSDGVGNGHVLWTSDGTTYHWDSAGQITSSVTSGSGNIIAADGIEGDYIHMVWGESDDNWPGHLEDLMYQRSNMTEPLNVTDHSQPPTFVSNIWLTIDETDTAHILWQEGTPSYYNSHSHLTIPLSGTLNMTGGIFPPIYEQPLTARGGTGYVLLGDENNPSKTPFWLWQSDTRTYTPIPSVYGPTASTASRLLWLNGFNEVEVAWIDNSLSGEGTNLHFWNLSTGSQDVSLSDETDGDLSYLWNAQDVIGRSYLVWVESSNGFSDVYGGYEDLQFTEFVVYLPIVIEP